VRCRDNAVSARFFAEIYGLPDPIKVDHFMVVRLGNGVTFDFMAKDGDIASQHYALKVSEADFDAIMTRIESRGLDYWADPARRRAGEINTRYGGRGVYFPDPDGHLLEALTVSMPLDVS
jgi:catechol 2,3-dioxygenase-like lactoylglutathione lyase family enzyme